MDDAIEQAKEMWEQSRHDAALAHENFGIALNLKKRLGVICRQEGFTEEANELDRLVKDAADHLKSMKIVMDEMFTVYESLLEKVQKRRC